jgi:phosphatidylglycerophosphate synthase
VIRSTVPEAKTDLLMGLLLQLVWLILVAAMIVAGIRTVLIENSQGQMEGRENGPRFTTLFLILLCLPPLFVFMVTNTFLMFSHPTVQFTAGSKLAGDLWSMWSRYWHVVLGISFMQIPVLVIVTVLTLVVRKVRAWRTAMSLALLSAILGAFIVAIASPRA